MHLLVSPAVSVDITFFVIILLGILIGTLRGFIKGICKIAGTILSIFVAFTFCNAFRATLDSWFALTPKMATAFHNATLAGWASLVLSFIILLIGTKLLAWLCGKIGTVLVEKVKVFRTINRGLGGILGLFEALVLIFLLLMVCKWISAAEIDEFLCSSTVVGKIYQWEWFEWAATLPFLKLKN